GLDVDLAGVAGFDPDVRVLLDAVHRQLLVILFATVGTQEAAELPLGQTLRAQQVSLASIAFGPQDCSDRLLAAQGTHGLDGRGHWTSASVGLRLCACKELAVEAHQIGGGWISPFELAGALDRIVHLPLTRSYQRR